MSETITLNIDGKDIKAEKGANLLKVARDNGSDIPGLCFMKSYPDRRLPPLHGQK